MYMALFYKEWLKLKWYMAVLAGVTVFVYLRIFININAVIDVKGAYHLWSMIVYKGFVVYSDVKYILPFSGFVIAAAQFIPETRDKRLRLLFHLPLEHNKSLGFMIATGGMCVSLVLLANFFLLWGIMRFFFPFEIVSSALISSAPWFFSGLTAYLGVSLAVIEPGLWRKAVYLALAFAMVMLFFLGRGYNLYENSLWKYILLSSLYIFTVFHPAFRFKRGIG